MGQQVRNLTLVKVTRKIAAAKANSADSLFWPIYLFISPNSRTDM